MNALFTFTDLYLLEVKRWATVTVKENNTPNCSLGSRDKAQCIWVLTLNWTSMCSTQVEWLTITHSSSSRGWNAPSDLHRNPHSHGHICTYKNKNKSFFIILSEVSQFCKEPEPCNGHKNTYKFKKRMETLINGDLYCKEW